MVLVVVGWCLGEGRGGGGMEGRKKGGSEGSGDPIFLGAIFTFPI